MNEFLNTKITDRYFVKLLSSELNKLPLFEDIPVLKRKRDLDLTSYTRRYFNEFDKIFFEEEIKYEKESLTSISSDYLYNETIHYYISKYYSLITPNYMNIKKNKCNTKEIRVSLFDVNPILYLELNNINDINEKRDNINLIEKTKINSSNYEIDYFLNLNISIKYGSVDFLNKIINYITNYFNQDFIKDPNFNYFTILNIFEKNMVSYSSQCRNIQFQVNVTVLYILIKVFISKFFDDKGMFNQIKLKICNFFYINNMSFFDNYIERIPQQFDFDLNHYKI